MTTTFIGTAFPPTFQWHVDEWSIINSIQQQIDQQFPNSDNLYINTTWFGPQFNNGQYTKFLSVVKDRSFDKIFLLAAADPVFLNHEQINKVQELAGAKELYLIGHFDTEYHFNFHATILPKYFKHYNTSELLLKTPRWVYLNYNRKPRDHRKEFVDKLFSNQLDQSGIITLGEHLTLGEKPEDYAKEGNWGMNMDLGIPHDIHSLGNMEYWQNHFLTVVSETEFWPWDNTFVSEKTWKPILGLRPFVLNGQVKIYQWLRDRGFKTFNHYFNNINIEDVLEFEVHDSIISVLKYLVNLSDSELLSMYQDMLPALMHNRDRFFEFSQEQQQQTKKIFI